MRMDEPEDLSSTRAALIAGRSSALQQLQANLAAADAISAVFVRRFDDQARVVAQAWDAQRAAGVPCPTLAGLAVSVKDLFDVAGQSTSAGSPALADAAPATADATVVARLRAAGAAFIGHTNMSQFAYSGVGINPHLGTPHNAATPDRALTPRVPGGSTSGGAVSVACGAAWAALGSDTGGSIRIPAALQGLVGFKNTQRLTPLDGSVPLSPTLDTACAITRSVRDAIVLHEVLAARAVALRGRPVHALRLAVPRAVLLDGLEPAVAAAFDAALRRLRDGGAQLVDVDWPELAEPAALQSQGGFPAAESWAAHRGLLARAGDRVDPRVVLRMRRGEGIKAAELIELHQQRRGWIMTMQRRLAAFDAALSPTLPIVAPPLAPLLESDERFFATNALLLRNPSIVNFLDGCAISLPCHRRGEMPVGLMLWSSALQDDSLLDTALAVEAALAATPD